MITYADIEAATERIKGRVVRTPLVRCEAIERITGGQVWLKLDSLQVVGAFKERGAANRMALLSEAERTAGVIAMSAGNHAQAVARHASLLGIRAVIVMPAFTPLTKINRTARWGAEIVLHGDGLAEAAAHARELAARDGLVLIHPYDDDAIIAGQGTLAVEVLADCPAVDTMVVPVGGGGLVAGMAIAAETLKPGVTIFGVEVDNYAAMAQQLAGVKVEVGGSTIAEGIAVRDIGVRTMEIAREKVERVLTVSELAIESAIALLAEEAKIVAEGAGAAGVAALMTYPELFAGKTIAVPICGANIDNRALAAVLQRAMIRDGRLNKILVEIPDRPGVLGEIATRVGALGANIIEVAHHRLFAAANIQGAKLEVTFEARDADHAERIIAALREDFGVERLSS